MKTAMHVGRRHLTQIFSHNLHFCLRCVSVVLALLFSRKTPHKGLDPPEKTNLAYKLPA